MLNPRKFGQHFLVDRRCLEQIADFTELRGKTVLEIGAGTGNLTEFLSKKASKVTAVEIDPELIRILRKRFLPLPKKSNITIIEADALEFDFSPFKFIFGNLPYCISTPLLFKIIDSNFQQAVLCLQKEVAQRLVASPGSSDYSKLSVMAQSKCDIKLIKVVSRDCFRPVPGVDSALVGLKKRKKYELDENLVSCLFQHKNQSVKNALVHSSKVLGMERSSWSIG